MIALQRKAEEAARKGAAFAASAILAAVGAGFLTASAWFLLTEIRSPVFAASIIGGVYLGLAAIAMAIGLRKPHKRAEQARNSLSDQDLSPMQLVVVSFLQGLEQGRQSRRAT